MSKFEEKMYDFITHENNFHMAKEIVEMMPNVEERLFKDFWTDVRDRLVFKDQEVKWKIQYEEDIIKILPRIDFDYHFSFFDIHSKAMIGIGITENADKNNVQNILVEQGLMEGMKRAIRNTIAYYKPYPFETSSDFFMKSIIPSRRTGKVEEVANWIWIFITEFETVLNELNTHGK